MKNQLGGPMASVEENSLVAQGLRIPTFILGIVVLLYIASFVVFAVIRILTGISIQRLGYLCLKRISYEPKPGIKIDIRKFGFLLHRPTFAQPTWISIVLHDSVVRVDLREKKRSGPTEKVEGSEDDAELGDELGAGKDGNRDGKRVPTEKHWEKLLKLQKALEKLHKFLRYLKLIDIIITNIAVVIPEAGVFQVGSFTMMADTREHSAKKRRLLEKRKTLTLEQQPVEWMISVRNVLFNADGKEPMEVLNNCLFNLNGILEEGFGVIKDSAISIKFGRVNIPVDDFTLASKILKKLKAENLQTPNEPGLSFAAILEELAVPGSRTERIAEALLQSRELLRTVIENVKEVQIAIGTLLMTKIVKPLEPSTREGTVIVEMKELGMDIHRLDQKSPAHRMYFSSKDVAHQALLAVISVSVTLDDGAGHRDRLMYVPMITMTSKTTLPSKTIELVEKSENDRNANIVLANIVVTSPSVDLEPRHLPLLLSLMDSDKPKKTRASGGRAELISRLLPKASVKFSVHEPVVRLSFPSTEDGAEEESDMLISSHSSISADLESSHLDEGRDHYYLNASFRVAAHELYYQSVSGERHDLLQTETLEVRAQMTATPEVQVRAQAYLDTFALRIVRPEITKAIQQMALQLRSGGKSRKPERKIGPEPKPSFLRKLPLWLAQLNFDGKDIVVEIAGVDKNVSEKARGIAIQVETWTALFSCQKQEIVRRPGHRRRVGSKLEPLSPSDFHGSRGKATGNPTDGRSFSMECNGVEGYIWEGPDQWEQEPFFTIPTVSTEFTTSTDPDGQLLHVVSRLESFDVNYSLQNHYTCYVAAGVIRDAIGHGLSETRHARILSQSLEVKSPLLFGGMAFVESPAAPPEFMSFDLRVKHIKIKAKMPADPALMLTIEGLDAGLQRWAPLYCKARSIRAFSQSPKVPSAWVRIVSIRHMHTGVRTTKRQVESGLVTEHSLEVDTDAIRLGIPHQFTLYRLTDNIVNTAKSVEQMHYRHKTGTTGTIQKVGNQPAKKVPRIALRSKALLFELEDDPFESRLNLIYRTGLIEQKLRLQRQAAYEAKVQKMAEAARAANSMSGRPMTSAALQPPRSKLRHRTRTMRSHKEKAGKNDTLRGRPRGDSEPTERPETSFGQEPMQTNSAVSLEEAYAKLQKLNSTMWIRKIRVARENVSARIVESRRSFWGSEEIIDAADSSETLLRLPTAPSLLTGYFNDVDITVDKPSFDLKELPDFLYRVGKGLPKDTQFAFLVPMSIKMDFKEARILLRDYPLPFIHVPRMGIDQSSRVPSWSLSSDIVIAEELWGKESKRTCRVNIITPTDEDPNDEYHLDIIRTVAPVKSYSDFKIKINTSEPTQITWCTAYQPAIQDMMMVFETFSKPHVDTSERVGFWDKIRLVLHSELTLSWKDNDGEVQLNLKGSRDPYKVTGKGAGFVMCWRGNVQWTMGRDHEPQKFMKVEGDEFVLAIPSFNVASERFQDRPPATAGSGTPSYSEDASARFKKVVMKLSGRLRFMIGLAFEQDLGGSDDWKERKRSFDFIPHYAVTLRSPEYCIAPPGEVYDAFKGFRSQYIHLSISIVCPLNRNWAFPTQGMSASYNTIHLTPRFFTHFFSWWQLFAGNMSLPIRQGALWPGPEKSPKKFARHLATIEYQLLLSPLFISHIYKHNENEDGSFVGATGLKCRLDSFMMDLHQRREEVTTTIKGLNKERRTFGMKMNQAMVDFHMADIRAISATIAGATAEDMKVAEEQNSYHEGRWMAADMNKFDIHDDDYSWVDLDDFIEVDWELPPGSTPQTVITPMAFTPRFTYFRQTDHSDPNAPISERPSPFGIDVSHDCIITDDNDPKEIQCSLVAARLEKVHHQMKRNKEALDNLAQRLNKDPSNEQFKQESRILVEQSSMLFNKICFLESMLRKMSEHLDGNSSGSKADSGHNGRNSSDTEPEMPELDSAPFNDYISDFDNRFIVHNLQAKWNNSLRNTILRYIHQINQRRGFVYYMSRRAVKFILDIIEERERESKILQMNVKEQEKQTKQSKQNSGRTSNVSGRSTRENSLDQSGIGPGSVEDQLKKLLEEANKYTKTNSDSKEDIQWYMNNSTATKACREDVTKDISEDYIPLNSYHVRLIAPQIQMQSDKGKDSAVLVTAEGMQLNIVSIMDKKRITDDVSGLVQRRYLVNMDNAQFFVTHFSDFAQKSMWLHSANRYGALRKTSWPPWIPLENMFDFRNSPLGFSRIVDRTSAILRYDKHNSLRLKYSDQVSDADQSNEAWKDETSDMEKRIDNVWVDFPKLQAKCDSAEYYAMFMIVQDVLLYSEPAEKLRSEKLEKIMLASDFSDLRGAPEMVERLQEKVNQLVELKHHLQTHSRQMDGNVWDNVLTLDMELNSSEEELFFLMKAITTVQRKYEDKSSSAGGVLRWYLSASDVVWNLLRADSGALAEFQLKDASYQRVDNADGSNYNTLDVRMMRGFNLLPNAVYPEMIAPYYSHEPTEEERENTRLLRVEWHMLEAIAGIPVINHFQVDLFPLKIQLEREIGEKLFQYIFPNNGKEGPGFSPFNVQAMKTLPGQGAPLGDKANVPNGGISTDLSRDEADISNNNSEQNSLIDEDDFPQPIPGLDLDAVKAASTPAVDEQLRPMSAVPQSARLLPKVHSDTAIQSLRGVPQTPRTPMHNDASNEMLSVNRVRRSNDSAAPSMNTILGEPREKPQKRKIFHRSSDKQQAQSDELTQMISRASSYMSLVYVKIPSVVLFLSYKGRGERNFEDVHEFVFKMPMLEYRNKTWSNLDLALRLKKDIMKALISHTGAILENKLTHQRPNTKAQPKFLRMMGAGSSSTTTSSPPNPDSGTISRTSSDLIFMSTVANNNNNEDLSINTNVANRNLAFNINVQGPSPSPRRSSVKSVSSIMSADSNQSGNHVLSDYEDNVDRNEAENPLRTAFRSMTASRPATRDGGRPTTREGIRPTTREGVRPVTREGGMSGFFNSGTFVGEDGRKRTAFLNFGKKAFGGGGGSGSSQTSSNSTVTTVNTVSHVGSGAAGSGAAGDDAASK